jgi:RNA polymerase sigma factor (TIGR02999 family)
MSDVTRILSQIEQGDPQAAEKLLPLVYEELRKLAAAKLAQEKPGQTLQATALVHEAYIRLVDVDKAHAWNSRGHFFGAAAEAMRRILVDQARRKDGPKAGGNYCRVELSHLQPEMPGPNLNILSLNELCRAGIAGFEAAYGRNRPNIIQPRRQAIGDRGRRQREGLGCSDGKATPHATGGRVGVCRYLQSGRQKAGKS